MDNRQSPATQALYNSLQLSLNLKSIRVLDLEASGDSTNENKLYGQLRVVNLVEKPSYVALSYVWGTFSDNEKYTIFCGTNPIKITPNCWSALWHIRKAFGTITVWVDAICINQADDQEKLGQIPLMGDIYSWADSTYIWLGEGNEHSNAAINFLKEAGFQQYLLEASPCSYRVPKGYLIRFKLAFKVFWESYYFLLTHLLQNGKLRFSRPDIAFWTANNRIDRDSLIDFFRRQWTTRIWTLQEVLLSEQLVIICGTKALSWRSLLYAIAFLEHSGPTYRLEDLHTESYNWRRIVALWVSMRYQSFAPDSGRSIPEVTHELSLQHCLGQYFEFLDKTRLAFFRIWDIHVYFFAFSFLPGLAMLVDSTARHYNLRLIICGAVVMLTSVVMLLPSFKKPNSQIPSKKSQHVNVREAIVQEIRKRRSAEPRDKAFGMYAVLGRLGLPLSKPDYSRDLHDVYRDLFISLIEWTDSLNPILCAQFSEDLTSPSWIPDWQLDVGSMWLEEYAFAKNPYQATNPPGSHPATPPLWKVVDQSKIAVRGCHVSRVTWRGSPLLKTGEKYDQIDDCAHIRNIDNVQRFWAALPEKERIDQRNLMPLIWSVHTTHYSKLPPVFINSSRIDVMWYPLMQWSKAIVEVSVKSAQLVLEDLKGRSKQEQLQFHISLCNDLAAKRRIFIVAEEKWMGNGPENAQVGDIITLICGVSMPLILRPHKDGYRFVGYVYIDAHDIRSWENSDMENFEDIILH